MNIIEEDPELLALVEEADLAEEAVVVDDYGHELIDHVARKVIELQQTPKPPRMTADQHRCEQLEALGFHVFAALDGTVLDLPNYGVVVTPPEEDADDIYISGELHDHYYPRLEHLKQAYLKVG